MSAVNARFWPGDPKAAEDDQGRRVWVARWEQPDAAYRNEPSLEDGLPVGYRRGQVFRSTLADMLRSFPGAAVLERDPNLSPSTVAK